MMKKIEVADVVDEFVHQQPYAATHHITAHTTTVRLLYTEERSV